MNELMKWLVNASRVISIIFCALRACDIITWGWFWIISPIVIYEVVAVIYTIALVGKVK